jgi:hypothetical protein
MFFHQLSNVVGVGGHVNNPVSDVLAAVGSGGNEVFPWG